jgi:predicted secreted protein
MGYFKVTIFILTSFFLLTCEAMAMQPPDNTASSSAAPKVLTMEDNGKEIELSPGETIKVELEFSGGTGYLWYVDGLDESRLKLTGEEVKDISPQNPDKGPLMGGPSLSIRTFKAVAPGDTTLRLLEYRTWEGKEKAINRFEVKVHIAGRP